MATCCKIARCKMNIENKTEWTPYLATAYAEGFCEGADATEDEQIGAWQYLINTGLCWQLQGWYGRTAMRLIEAGICDKVFNVA